MKKYLLFFSIIILFSCNQHEPSVDALGISVDSFRTEISTPGVILLDVRTPEEYSEGHLANSLNIDFKDENFSRRIDSLDKNKPYDLYCRSGHRSGESVKLMKAKGFSNVHHLDGGILKWQERGNALVK